MMMVIDGMKKVRVIHDDDVITADDDDDSDTDDDRGCFISIVTIRMHSSIHRRLIKSNLLHIFQ